MTDDLLKNPVSTAMRQEIEAVLGTIERDHDVEILFAIESGSRAWGFPSPDSDYDVRFVYRRPLDWYLSIEPGRDVIELPISGDLDVNGWDVQKALGLMLKANPVLLEWLSSPIKYRWNASVATQLTDLAGLAAYGTKCRHHYLRLAERQWDRNIEGQSEVNLKRYFYCVRPAMALRWLRLRPGAPPPMNFDALAEGIDLAPELIGKLKELLVLKSRTKELGDGLRIPVIDTFVTSEMEQARGLLDSSAPITPDLRVRANDLFRTLVKEAGDV
ncbi:MAG: nucleotidyltransferase domain-containing protein [Pseudomonadota bacterium]